MNKISGPDIKKTISPVLQFAVFAGLGGISIIITSFIAQEKLTIWMFAAAFLLLFSIFNNVQSMFVVDFKKYVIHSVYAFTFLLIGLILLASTFSGLSIYEASPYRNIFLVLFISNFIFISMIMMVKGLLIFLGEKDEKL
jgi:hypothetical protein